MSHPLETFIEILPKFRQFSERDDVVAQLGDSGISAMYSQVFRCRHDIKRLLASGMAPGNDLFVCALGMRGELNMEQLLNYGLARAMRDQSRWTQAIRGRTAVEKKTMSKLTDLGLLSEPVEALPVVTHNVGKTLH